ncbi:SDR family NAD(P)-dependent oxidoreductase [Meiothermus sp. QL-1]|uniref:SDR family NAD(P)-dependent oxidoreductase n=1 Tax=Meiothermus sp. QL-1 TaxID=2058095 RepID=UPI001F2DC890|nr:SDR family NAD(P)-dependent oxidoreductase [Meiothermus sp. QL-1]
MGVCLIVGVGRGLGLSLARRFGQGGYALALVARRAERLESYAGALELDGYTARAYAADAASAGELTRAVRQAERQLGPVEVLIYNAAASREGSLAELAPEALEATLRVNLLGALTAAQLVLPGMRARQRGTLLFTGEGLALNPEPHQGARAIGKAALRTMVGVLSKELYREGIHVATVTIAPHAPIDPDRIAEQFWALHSQPPGRWQTEAIYRG